MAAAVFLKAHTRSLLQRGRALLLLQARNVTSDGYLHKSTIPTMYFQQSLPRLPIPPLEQTLSKLLLSATPVVNAEQLQELREAIEDFKRTDGPILHNALIAHDKSLPLDSSYISGPWFDMYLAYREPSVINVNPQLSFSRDPIPEKNTQLEQATAYIASSVRFYRTLRDGFLKPEVYHGSAKTQTEEFQKELLNKVGQDKASEYMHTHGAIPADMSQYKRLFLSTRLPKRDKDVWGTYEGSKHIIVQRGSDFYSFDVLKSDGSAVSSEIIKANIAHILAQPFLPSLSSSPSLGILTTMNRDAWADARETLVKDSTNADSILKIDSALFLVCLESEKGTTESERSRLMMHGNGRNRWFDKSFELVITGAGKTAVNFEHSWGDGVTIQRYMNEVYADVLSSPIVQPASSLHAHPERLCWDVSEQMKKVIDDAEKEFDRFSSTYDLQTLDTEVVSGPLLKQHKVSPDGFLQMAFQLAYFNMFGRSVSTYESSTTNRFKLGRTETIRSCSIDSDAFCREMAKNNLSVGDKRALLLKAIHTQAKISTDAKNGNGWDRHITGLKFTSKNLSRPLHPLFTSQALQVLGNIILSTSTVSSDAIDDFTFGPVGTDCFGIGYGLKKHKGRFGITSFQHRAPEFARHLDKAIRDMYKTLTGQESSASSQIV